MRPALLPLRFGEKYIFPKNSLTGYKRHSPASGEADTYDLYTLFYFLKHAPETTQEWIQYVKSARDSKIPQVAFPDRKVKHTDEKASSL